MIRNKKNQNAIRETLGFSNSEIISNRLRFSKLIKAFEDIPWEDAQKKAGDIISSNEPDKYIDKVREQAEDLKTSNSEPTQSSVQLPFVHEDKSAKNLVLPIQNKRKELAEENFLLLQNIFDNVIFKKGFYAVASKLANPDYSFQVLKKGANGFYCTLISYREIVQIAEERFTLKMYIDFDNEKVLPIYFSDIKGKRIVYFQEDVTGFVKETERESQNIFLNALLKELGSQGYSFVESENIILKQVSERHQIEMQKIWEETREEEAEEQEPEFTEEELFFMREARRLKILKNLEFQINSSIPQFQIGKVQLTDIHKKMGLSVNEINWINENRQGFIAVANIQKIADKLDDFSELLWKEVKRIGMRVTRHGKILIEGTSVRLDLTDYKL